MILSRSQNLWPGKPMWPLLLYLSMAGFRDPLRLMIIKCDFCGDKGNNLCNIFALLILTNSDFMHKLLLPAVAAALLLTGCCGQNDENLSTNVTPAPVSLTQGKGCFVLNTGTVFVADCEEETRTAAFFAQKLRTSTGYELPVTNEGEGIELCFEPESGIAAEGYQLSVSPNGVKITASDESGLFYGMQTFMQLLPAQVESPCVMEGVIWSASSVEINDWPRFGYRGVMVDPCRNFKSVDWLKKQIDVYGMYKINIMHLHLTEDQGWRFEVKKYPKLTEMGSERVLGEGGSHKGYYTQEELKDLVAYAAQRHITIIPELEIPGHELAAIHAYPELSCRDAVVPVRQVWGVEDVVMCPGKGTMFEFLKDVIDEMVQIFPGEYFHIGGDECPKDEWASCPACQKMIRELGLDKFNDEFTPEQHLQTWIVEYFEKYLARYGKRIIGWDEILEGDLTKGAIVMSWRGVEGGIKGGMKGNEVIMTPSSEGYYLDYFQGDYKTEPVGIGGYAPLEKTYTYDPVPDTLKKLGKESFVKGVQGNCWSEYFYAEDIAEYRTFPRIIAIAETGWTHADKKDWNDFSRRIDSDVCVRLAAHDINFHIPMPEQPFGSCDHVVFTGDRTMLTFKTTRPEKMVYTLDGSEPDASSAVYTEPLAVTENTSVKIRTVLPSGQMSSVRTVSVEKVTAQPAASVDKSDLEHGLRISVKKGYYLTVDALHKSAVIWKEDVIHTPDELSAQLPGSTDNNVTVNTPQYGAVARGYIEVPMDGVFYIHSDLDLVKIDGNVILDHQGEVKRYTHDDCVALAAGLHEIELTYLGNIIGGVPSGWSGDKLKVRYEGSNAFMSVPAEYLWYKK